MNKIRKMSQALLVALLLFVGGLAPVTVYAADEASSNEACEALRAVGKDCNPSGTAARDTLGSVVGRAVRILVFVVGVASILMIINGGFKYITSAGDSTKTANAKNTIMYALIGLVLAALAQVVVNIVVGSAP